MAHVFRPTYTQSIPPHATRRGDRVRWKARGGAVKEGTVLDGDPTRCSVESPCWYVAYSDHTGKSCKRKGYASKAATEQLMSVIVRDVERIRSGILPPESARPRRSLDELLTLWERTMAAEGTAKHSRTERLRAARVVASVGATRAADLTPAAVTRAVDRIKKAEDFNGQTAAHHIKAIKGFSRWLWLGENVEPTDYLAGLRRRSDETDPRHQRRALSAADFARLVTVTRASETVVYGLTGPERAALYDAAASTGFRASELASLTVADVTDGGATVAAGFAKNRRRDTIPLSDDAAAELAALVAGRKPGERVWPDRTGNVSNVWYNRGADMLRRDLETAGIPYADGGGRVFDFHSLRGQFATDLMRAGVPQGRAQKLMRHSTPHLTAKHYQRADEGEMRDDVNRLRK